MQGESTHVGRPCVFVRLAGCNLRCTWCDSAFTFTGGTHRSIDDVLSEVEAAGVRLVEITGGEPLVHRQVVPLMERLLARGFEVLLETSGSRDISVVPVNSEQRLRKLDWIETNRKKVDEMSGGKLAYVYLPDTGNGGFTAFNRYYFAQTDKQGVVIDERFNGGGQMADYIIEVLGRGLQSFWSARYGAIERTPAAAILGPKVMIANEVSGSGGDALPWMFKTNKLGPLVGKRTWGGLVGIGGTPQLMDGAQVTSPNVGFFTPGGEWEVENYGVAPDVEVDQDPKAVAAGRDPQLEEAVRIALDLLESRKPV